LYGKGVEREERRGGEGEEGEGEKGRGRQGERVFMFAGIFSNENTNPTGSRLPS
jgi:hypothetical protein